MATSLITEPPARRSRAESKAETRRLVLDAAEIVFADQGYHGASLAQVAAHAGFTKGAVYSTFESKADLFLAVLGRRAIERQAAIHATLETTTSAEDLLGATAAALSRFGDSVAGERGFWAALIEFMIVVGRDENLQAHYAAHHDASREAVARSIQEWADRSEATLAVEPRELATAVMALNFGLTLEGLIAPGEVSPQLYANAQLGLLRGTLKADEGADG